MSLELLNAAATVGTFLVIAATAIAAIVQLRHLRRGNQLSGLVTVFGMLTEPSVRELVNFVRYELAERLQDDDFRAGLLETPIDRRKHPELYLCDIYNHIGSFIRAGLIDERIYLQTDWWNVNLYWGLLADVVAITRTNRPYLADVVAITRTNRPYLFENFEYLASRARTWAAAHPTGDYPSGERRMLHDPKG